MVRPKAPRAPAEAPGLALHAVAARLEALLKERERLLREVGKRKRLIEQARAQAERDGNEAASKLGPLFLRHQTLAQELTALFDSMQSEPYPVRARNVIGKLRASLQAKGVLTPLSETDPATATATATATETDPDACANPFPHRRSRAASSAAPARPDFASAHQPSPERRPLREIFRSLARALHPDQARTEAERSRRTEVMKEITRAYGRGDLARLLELEGEWQATRAPAPDASEAHVDSLARCQELERTNRELLKQVRQLTSELKDTKEGSRRAIPRSLARTAATAARELEQLEALCELVREFKRGNRSLAELALGEFLI
jgi:hypothetical protein